MGNKFFNKGWDYYRNSIGFFIVGTINNICYVVVNSSAQSLCDFFDAGKWNPLILWCNVFAGFFLRICNMLFLYKIPAKLRVLISTIFGLIGLFGIVISIVWQRSLENPTYWLFFLCLCSILIIGGVQSFAESVMLSYQGLFEPEIVNWWSSGTGFAGVAGSGLYLFFTGLKVEDTITFSCLMPLYIVYAFIFFVVIRPSKHKHISEDVDNKDHVEIIVENHENETDTMTQSTTDPKIAEKQTLLPKVDDKDENEILHNLKFKDEEEIEEGTYGQKLMNAIKQTWWLGLNMTLIYYFEYVINPGAIYVALDRNYANQSDNFFVANYYEVLAFCYQLGVFISRSSLPLCKFKPIYLLTIAQFLLMIFMSIQGNLHFLVEEWGTWIMIVTVLIVGLVGGSGYVQIMYWILKKDMKKETREMGLSFITAFANVALMASSVTNLILNQTLWEENYNDNMSSLSS